MFEDLEPRPARGAPLIALTREDLDGYSVEDLKQRIAGLQAEIARSTAARASRPSAMPPTPCSIFVRNPVAIHVAWPLHTGEAPRHPVPVVIRMRLPHESG